MLHTGNRLMFYLRLFNLTKYKMKKQSIYTIAILALMVIGVGFVAPSDIKITLTEQEANQVSQSIDKATQIVNDSDMKADERKEVKRLLVTSMQLLVSKIDKPIDTVKKAKKK